ncbi:MAG: HAMP domain-containing histidine kinase [Dyadobacter sp.]|uniref:sensor histidine kinase n=1 Tax=Dyadobacter sp. TaxID=1914288 RepID=UPI001B242DAF|nr:HAMP domain-containing sensor histidine kinase [Dyadobacter sp.]MBO9611245.1 HAMP domain-containing histidine kinase [Dyadobacter sp.]
MKKYNLQLGAVMATVVTLSIVPVRLAEGQGANLVSLVGSEIVIWLMCMATWLSSYQTYYKFKLVKWQKIAVALLFCAVISNLFFLASFRLFEDYPLKSMRELPLWIITIRLSLRGLLLGLIMVPIIFLLETERERQEEALKRERDRVMDAERQKHVLEALVSERTADLEEALSFLGESQEELDHQVYLLTRVVASIAHDVHAPLQFMITATKHTGKFIDNKQYEQASEYNQQVERGLDDMAMLMQNLLEFARNQIHRGALHLAHLNLAALVREKAGLFEPIVIAGGNTLQISLNENLTVNCNANLLGVILHNLLDNAIKNTRDGEIQISSAIAGDRLHLYIENPVGGVAPDGILQTDGQGKPGQYPARLGRDNEGLGLILVRDIAALLNIGFAIEAVAGKVVARLTFSEFLGS